MAKGRKRRWFVTLAAPAIVLAAYRFGVVDLLRDPAAMHALATAHPVAAPLVYLATYTVVSAFGLPGLFFLIPSALVFPRHEAFALGIVGSILSSWLAFALTRSAFRPVIEPRIPKRLRIWDERIEQNQLMAVVTARLTFFLLPPVSWALALTKVRTTPYLVGTFIGMLPGVWFCVYVGGSFLHWMREQPWWAWAIACALVVTFLVVRRFLAGRDPEDSDDDDD